MISLARHILPLLLVRHRPGANSGARIDEEVDL
jgi:hypothetical protein